MLRINNLSVTLSKGTPLATTAIKNLHLNVAAGDFVIIIGSNGSGKSTLFNSIIGNVSIDAGSIEIDDCDICHLSYSQRTSYVSLVMQDPRIGTMPDMTIEENLSLAYMRGKSRGLHLHNTIARRKLFKQKLSLLNMHLEDNLDQLVGNLSGGQRQALSLIMAIIADYKIILLDEITAALDPVSGDQIMELAANLVSQHQCSALMITHNLNHALRYGNRMVLLKHGKIERVFDKEQKNNLEISSLTSMISA